MQIFTGTEQLVRTKLFHKWYCAYVSTVRETFLCIALGTKYLEKGYCQVSVIVRKNSVAGANRTTTSNLELAIKFPDLKSISEISIPDTIRLG